MRAVTLPAHKDDTVTLAAGFDFRAPSQRYHHPGSVRYVSKAALNAAMVLARRQAGN